MKKVIFLCLLVVSFIEAYGQACDPPTSFFPGESTVLRICKGESITLDGSGSYAEAPFGIEKYYWDYGDGANLDSLTGPIITRSFAVSGNYRIVLYVKDDNPNFHCLNGNFSYLDILVAPDPIFQPMTIGGPICLGESLVLDAFPDQYSQEWNLNNYGSVQDPVLEDNQGSQNTNSVNVTDYTPGQTITNVNEIPDVFVNLEHEFIGDLVITIICPGSGASVVLHDGQGSSEALGVPVHNDNPHVNGIGYDYVWSPSAVNGDWGANATPNSGSNNNDPPLAPGTYESENPMDALIGCDLNGVWQFIIVDELGSDDGTLFNWGVTFPPSLFNGGITSFIPIIGLQSDSSTWSSGPGAVISPDGNTAIITPASSGSQSYTYTITDNHGCTNDTTVTVNVTPNPVTNAGVDATVCANVPFQLGASVSPNPGAVVYTWSPVAGLSNANIANPLATISADMTYTVQAYRTGHPLCFTEDQVSLTITNPPAAGADNSVDYCQNDPAVNLNTLLDGTAVAGGLWFDGNENTPLLVFNPAMQGTDTLIYVTGDPLIGCTDTAQIAIQVALPFVLNQSNDTLICENGTAVLGVSPTGGFGTLYVETWSQGLIGNGSHSVSPLVNECYDVFVTDANGCVSQTETICVNMNPPLQLTNSGNITICLNTSTLLDPVITVGGDGGPYNYEWSDGTNTIASISQVNVSPTQLTQYCLTMSDNCESTPVTECLEVNLYEQPEAVFSADEVDGCFPVQVTFTNETTPHLISSSLWSFGNGVLSDELGDVTTVYGAPICYDVKLTVTSADGCIDDTLMANYICPFDYPVAEFKMNPNPTTFFDTNIEFENLSSEDVAANKWSFGVDANPPISDLEELMVRFPSEKIGVYPVTLVVINNNGCVDSITHELIVNSVFTLYVPNAFSPNNDGENETFFAKGESVAEEEFLLRVFDRNGGVVFESTDIKEEWTGNSSNGTKLPVGVYVWKIQAKDIYSDVIRESYGYVSLIR